MKHLRDSKNLDSILDLHAVVNLKIDASAFVVGKEDSRVKYWSREGRDEIDLLRRIAINIWEDPIRVVNPIEQILPDNTKIFCEFFYEGMQSIIPYNEFPRKRLLISYSEINGKIVSPTAQFNDILSNIIGIDPPPVLFEGRLDKDSILRLCNSDDFQRDIVEVFPIPENLKYLTKNGIEGICIYFCNDEGEVIDVYKVVDPSFTRTVKEKKSDDDFNTKLNRIIYSNILNFIDDPKNIDFHRIISRFLELDVVLELEEDNPEQDVDRFSRVNFSQLKPEIYNLYEEHWIAEDICRILLLIFRKKKSRANPKIGLTREIKDSINKIIE